MNNHKITELASFEGREFNIDYIPGINGYKKTQNGIITIITADKSETELSEKQFLKFDVRTYYDEYKNPTSYIVYKDLAFDYCDETVLMCKTKSESKIIRRGKFDYNDISVVTKKNMIIIGEEDVITHEKRYGVIDSLTGEEVIPFGYDKIVYNSFYDKFIDDNNRIITYSTNKIKVK